MQVALRLRSEVPAEETWNLEELYTDEAEFEAGLTKAEEDQATFVKRIEAGVNRSEDLLELIQMQDGLISDVLNLTAYASSKFAEDGSNSNNQARQGRVSLFMGGFITAKAAFAAKIRSIAPEVLTDWLASSDALGAYQPFLTEKQSGLEHRLSDEVEAVLAQYSSFAQTPEKIYSAALGADMSFQPVLDSDGNEVSVTPFYMLMSIETSRDTELRHRAYQSLTDGLRPYQNVLAAGLGAHIQRQVSESKLRGYPSVFHMLQASTTDGVMPNASNEVNPEHFFMVQDVMFRELAPHMRRYMNLRTKVLGLETPLLCDVKAPLQSLHGERIPYGQARELILSAAKPLGDEYARILNRAFDERWVYRARNAGNWNGAFCGFSGNHPYVFSPFGEGLYDTFILGHELGHAVHLDLSSTHQLPSNRSFSSLFVETPSTLMEHMLARHLREITNDQDTLRRVNMLQLFTFHHNFVTHQTEAEILRRLYQTADSGKPLSTATFCEISRTVNQEFWGDTVKLDEGADLYWMRQPHYYMGIYPYTYAVGLVGSTVLARRIAQEGDSLLQAWIEVLTSGATRPPLELYKMVGIDMASPEPYREAIEHVGKLVEELEKSYQE